MVILLGKKNTGRINEVAVRKGGGGFTVALFLFSVCNFYFIKKTPTSYCSVKL